MSHADLIARGLGASFQLATLVDGASPPRSDLGSAYRLYLLSGQRIRVAELDDFSLDAVLRFNAPGSWSVETTFAGEAPDWLRFGGYGSGIAVTRDGETILVGVLEEREIVEAGDVVTLRASGRDALVLLEDRWTDPVGGSGGPTDYSGSAYDFQQGAAETVMRHYVNVNALGGARSDRALPNAVLSPMGDSGSGGDVGIRARFDNLLTLLQSIATVADPQVTGLRFRLVESVSVPGRLEFLVETPRDLRGTVTFDRRLHNLARATLREYGPSVSAVVLGGQGEGEARTLREYVDAGSISSYARRIERFVDRRDTDDEAELAEAAAEMLAGGAGGFEFTIDGVLEDAPWRWGRDYDLGDRVRVIVAGVEGDGVVREVRLTIDADGVQITPLVGPVGASFSGPEARRLAAVEDRISHLERINQFGSVGMIMLWRRPPEELPVGWRICDGTTVNGYATVDLQGKFAIGVLAGTYDLLATGGAPTQPLAHDHGVNHSHSHHHGMGTLAYTHTHDRGQHAHSHDHSTPNHAHSHDHTGAAHTHPGSHSHGAGTLAISHNHATDIDHDHPAFDSGYTDVDTVAVGHATLGSGATDHKHPNNVPALGTTNITSGTPQDVSRSGSTDPDSNVFAASFSGNTGTALTTASSGGGTTGTALTSANSGGGSTGGVESPAWSGTMAADATGSSISVTGPALGTISILPPYRALHYIERVPAA